MSSSPLWRLVLLLVWATERASAQLVAASSAQEGTPRALHVEVQGRGAQQLLLIPCAGCDWHSWESFMARNQQRCTMHAVTLPGLGGTARWAVGARAEGTPLMEHYAAEIARYIREKQLRNVVIVGHSFGAAVAIKTVLDYPASASRMFLVDWGAVHPATLSATSAERLQEAEAQRGATLQQTDDDFSRQMREVPALAIANSARVPAYVEMFGLIDRLTSAQISYELRRYDWRTQLREIRIPVAAVFGLPAGEKAEAARQQARAVLPGVRYPYLQFLPNTGHWVMEERPQEFDQLLREFFSPTSRQPRQQATIREPHQKRC